jgi:integrase
VWTIKRTRSVAGVKVEGRMKRKRRDHILPLTPAMVALLKQALELNLGSEYLFPADMTRTRNGKEPRKPHVHGESVSHAMRRLRERIKLEDARVHDFRSCLTTWLSDNGFNREVDVRKVICRAQGRDGRTLRLRKAETAVRRALTAWGDPRRLGERATQAPGSREGQPEEAAPAWRLTRLPAHAGKRRSTVSRRQPMRPD